jgi:uncharacterized protein (TIGR02266 family)
VDTKKETTTLKVVCPYCTKEIAPGASKCRTCGTIFGVDTLKIIRSHAKLPADETIDERRQKDRVPKKFKITYPTLDALKEHYLINIGTGGVFIESKNPIKRGARFDLRIFLPDEPTPLDVYCEVVWAQNEERVIDNKRYPSGMGIKFLNLSVEGTKRIDRILKKK